jgi:hypothetical protein
MVDAALMVAGILGGSGNHVVQIIIGIVVVVGLIGYFLLRLGGRVGGGDARAVAAAVSQHARENATSDATLLLVRTWGLGGHSEQWSIVVDGTVVGSIADKETVEVAVEPGHRTFRLESGRHRSAERSFDVASGDVVTFLCNSPRVWPLLLVAFVKPDLWISLRRETS